MRIFRSLAFIIFTLAGPAAAQDTVFIQIEAQPSLTQAEDSLRQYASTVQDLNGFALSGGWYAIALGPYSADEAPALLRNLRRAGLIPRDSYVARPSDYASVLARGRDHADAGQPAPAAPDGYPQHTGTDRNGRAIAGAAPRTRPHPRTRTRGD